MRVTVQLASKVAAELHRSPVVGRSARAILSRAKRLGVDLAPIHPGSTDPALRSYFEVEVDGVETAERVANQLRSIEGVEAAYVKPPDEAP